MTALTETTERATPNATPIEPAPARSPIPARATRGPASSFVAPVQEQTPPQAIGLPAPSPTPPAGVTSSDQGQPAYYAHPGSALVGTNSPEGHQGSDTHPSPALGGTNSGTGANDVPPPVRSARPSLFDPTLYVLAQAVDDFEGQRKSQDNRLRILTSTEPDEDGEVRGFGLDESHPVVKTLIVQRDGIADLEHSAILALNRVMRKHPLAAWQKTQKGVGEKQLARLLAATGDPYIRTMPDGTEQPRTVSALWAYCGLHTLPAADQRRSGTHLDGVGGGATLPAGAELHATPIPSPPLPGTTVAAKRRKGVKANWSTDAKTRAYLIATSCIKQKGEYREVYEARRAHTAETHPDWTPGHSHNDGLRIVSKRILRDLWRAARDYHLEEA